MQASSPVLSIRGLTKTYDGKTPVLKGVSLDIWPGELVAVVGPSGAGKSTLIRCINRLVEPGGGEISFRGENVAAAGRRRLRQLRARLGMVFQHHNLIGRASVLANVLHGRLGSTPFYRSVFGAYPEADRLEARALLARVGLAARMHQRADTLSGGQMQRVGICRALIQRPDLLLADEPIASLDPASATAVMGYLEAMTKERGLASIVNLHQVDYARKYATRIVGLKDGAVVFDGPPGELTDEIAAMIYENEGAGENEGENGGDGGTAAGRPVPPPPKKTAVPGSAWAFAAAALVAAAFIYLGAGPLGAALSVPALFSFLGANFWPPNFDGFAGHVPIVLRTLHFAVVGTYISALLAFALGLLMSREMNPCAPLRAGARFFASFLRNVPVLVWASVLVFIFGIGALVGVVALVVSGLGFLGRSYAESMNDIAGRKLEAIRASGAGYAQVLWHGLLPEFAPAWLGWTLFSFEVNIRASAVLGMVGAGGLGLLIQTNLDLRGFRRAFALVIILAAMVLAAEFLANSVRKKIIGGKRARPVPAWGKGLAACGALGVFMYSAGALGLDFGTFASRLSGAGRVLSHFMAFDAAAVPEILAQLLVSAAVGVGGLAMGCALALALAFLAAENIAPFRPLAWLVKACVGAVRAIPSLVIILMAVAALGFGHTAGLVGLALSSAGYLTKAFAAAIEEQDPGIIEALRANGAGRLQIIWHGLLPQVFASFVSWVSIRLESNVADSVQLGIVGAGGVGMLVSRAARRHDFAGLATAVLLIFAAMLVLEFAASRIRARAMS